MEKSPRKKLTFRSDFFCALKFSDYLPEAMTYSTSHHYGDISVIFDIPLPKASTNETIPFLLLFPFFHDIIDKLTLYDDEHILHLTNSKCVERDILKR